MKPPDKYIELKNLPANSAIADDYRVMLNKLVNKMMSQAIDLITKEYKQTNFDIVTDSPVDTLYNTIEIIFGKWQIYFDQIAQPQAQNFTNEINKNLDVRFKATVRPIEKISKNMYDNFLIKISENTKGIALAKEASIKENVNLITNLSAKAKEQVHQAVMSSITRGRDTSYLTQELSKIKKLTKNRVRLIARDQTAKITSVLYTAKQANMGIKWAIWHHSHAGEKPRPTHVAMDGKKYLVSEGLYDSAVGEKIYPSMLVNCRCTASSVLPFEE